MAEMATNKRRAKNPGVIAIRVSLSARPVCSLPIGLLPIGVMMQLIRDLTI